MFNDEEVKQILQHHGILGQKWGVRRNRDSSAKSTSRFTPEQKALAKKVAVGTALLAAVAGASYIAHHLDATGNLPIHDIEPKTVSEGKDFVSKLVEKQTSIIHVARGKNRGHIFVQKGGLDDPLNEFEKAFGQHIKENLFTKLSDGRIAANLVDPEGRLDRAGRPINHEILIPKSMTQGIDSIDDLQKKIWPILKPEYDTFYPQNPSET